MSEPNAKKSKWEEALDRAEASIDWDKLEAKLDEDLKKLTEKDFPDDADQMLPRPKAPQSDLNK